MQDFTPIELEASRPKACYIDCLSHCLSRLYADKTHKITDEVVPGLTFEELIGTILLACDRELK